MDPGADCNGVKTVLLYIVSFGISFQCCYSLMFGISSVRFTMKDFVLRFLKE